MPSDAAVLQPALEFFRRGRKAMHVGDDVDGHEADIMAMHRILGPGIAEADPELHGADFLGKEGAPLPSGRAPPERA